VLDLAGNGTGKVMAVIHRYSNCELDSYDIWNSMVHAWERRRVVRIQEWLVK